MKYYFQFDIAAIITVLLAIFYLRRNYITKSNRIFAIMIWMCLLSAVFDLASCFTISYADSVPLGVNYFVSLGYLFIFNSMVAVFFMFVDSKARIPKLFKVSEYVSIAMLIFYAVTIWTSPLTHQVAYFEPDGTYAHGSLMMVFYIIPFVFFAASGVLFIIGRKRFNKYQVVASIIFIIGTVSSVTIQYIDNKLILNQLVMTLLMFFLYNVYENPGEFIYKDSLCYNGRAFTESIDKTYIRKNLKYRIAVCNIGQTETAYSVLSHTRMEKLQIRIAEAMNAIHKKKTFALDDWTYAFVFFEDEDTMEVSSAVNNLFKEPFVIEGIRVGLSIEWFVLDDLDLSFKGREIENIIEYRVKNPGYVIDSHTLLESVIKEEQSRTHLLSVIKRAIENEEFKVCYQPIYNVHTGRFESAEALLRLIDTELGFINPEYLVTVAEENNCVNQIEDIVFRKVCKFMRDSDIRSLGVKYIEVNLSPIHARSEAILDRFMSVADYYDIEPGQINLEITETAQIGNEGRLVANINAFAERKVTFSIDDYGSGFASADYLIKLPVSIVKIDKTILWNAMKDEGAMIVLKNTINMIKELGKKALVEGVEDEHMVETLKLLGCDYLQGYYFSKPIFEGEYLEFLKKHLK